MTQITDRAIVKQTPLYSLLGANNQITPGFFEIKLNMVYNKRVWMARVRKHLENFSDSLYSDSTIRPPQITYSSSHRYSFFYNGGEVAIIPDEKIVEISSTHPKMDETIQGFIRLALASKTPSVGF
jgi:hypothetical protein